MNTLFPIFENSWFAKTRVSCGKLFYLTFAQKQQLAKQFFKHNLSNNSTQSKMSQL
jgi:hypothetical protein